jgi:hypothetical protein
MYGKKWSKKYLLHKLPEDTVDVLKPELSIDGRMTMKEGYEGLECRKGEVGEEAGC